MGAGVLGRTTARGPWRRARGPWRRARAPQARRARPARRSARGENVHERVENVRGQSGALVSRGNTRERDGVKIPSRLSNRLQISQRPASASPVARRAPPRVPSGQRARARPGPRAGHPSSRLSLCAERTSSTRCKLWFCCQCGAKTCAVHTNAKRPESAFTLRISRLNEMLLILAQFISAWGTALFFSPSSSSPFSFLTSDKRG